MMQQPQSLLGELVVVALKAENLQHQAASKQDPFCIFRVNEIVKRTKTDYGGGSYPIWDDQVNIPIRQGQHRLHVQIFDKEANARNLMGEGVVDLTKVLREREHDGYFPVKYQGKHGGEIYLELTFYPIQQSMTRPQQPVRYQYPPGSNGYRPRPLPPLPQQQSHGHYVPSNQRPSPHQRPPPPHPVTHAPYSAPPHPSTPMPLHHNAPPSHMPHYHSTPIPPHSAPPQHSVPPYPPHSMPLPNPHPSYPQPRPSTSSQIMSSSQPLLSSSYHPGASSAPRPIQGSPYPPRPSGPYQPSPMAQPRPYPPGPSMRPMPHTNRPMYPPY